MRALLAARLHDRGEGERRLWERLLGPLQVSVVHLAAEAHLPWAAERPRGRALAERLERAPVGLAQAGPRRHEEPRVLPQAQARAEALRVRVFHRSPEEAEQRVPAPARVRQAAAEVRFRRVELAPPARAQAARRERPRLFRGSLHHPPGRVRQDRLALLRWPGEDPPVRLRVRPAPTASAVKLIRWRWTWSPTGWRPKQATIDWRRMSRDVSPDRTAIKRGARA